MRCLALFVILLLAPPLGAEELLTPEEFDQYTRGKTLFYGQAGEIYGAEIYHENRLVTWSFLDGDCKEGSWYAQGALICFTYEDNPAPQCWSFRRGARGLIARFENDPATTDLYEAQDTGAELLCLGPKVGV